MFKDELKPFSILYIEDEQEVLKKMVKHLSNHYINVYGTTDALEALEIYKQKKPEIIIVDIHLFGMSGLEFIKIVRKNDIKTQIIILSAHNEVEYLLEANGLKLTNYLVKPITRATLHKSLKKAIIELNNFIITPKNRLLLKNMYSWSYVDNELYYDTNIIDLRVKERRMLRLFFNNLNQTFTYDDISNELWDMNSDDKTNSIKLIIKELRKKLPSETISNVYGIGYKINIE